MTDFIQTGIILQQKKNMLKALLCLTTETWYAIEFHNGLKSNMKANYHAYKYASYLFDYLIVLLLQY